MKISKGFLALSLTIALQSCMQSKLQLPEPGKDGNIQTLNHMGKMSTDLSDPITHSFINDAMKGSETNNYLDVGAAYGDLELYLLKHTNASVTSLDLDEKHLKILHQRALECCSKNINRLKLIYGEFPARVTLENNKYDGVMISRVLHFMKPEQIKASMAKLHDTLKPGGKLYIITLSPYAYEKFLPEYRKRLKAGEEFPGNVDNIQLFADKNNMEPELYNSLKDRHYTLLDLNKLRGLLKAAGFKVEMSFGFSYSDSKNKWVRNNKSSMIGLIAVKP